MHDPPGTASADPTVAPRDPTDEALLRRRDDLLRTARAMFGVRWAAAVIGLALVLTYAALPFPPGYRLAALLAVGMLPVVNAVAWLALRRFEAVPAGSPRQSLRRVRALAVSTVIADTLIASAVVWAFAFDPDSAHWAILFVVPLLGAARFGMPGALATWAGVTVLYTLRQAWAAERFDDISFAIPSIAFRMGLAFLVALVAGLLARDLAHERERAALALAEVERVDRLRAHLVNALAHDIRSPLTVITGAIAAMTRGTELTADQETFLDLARRQAIRLNRLATGMLDLARLEQGQLALQVEPVVVGDVVHRAVEAIARQTDPITVEVDGDPVAMADDNRLEQMVFNLINNALTHGRPPISIRVAAADDGDVIVQVHDQGSGVDADERSRLFLPYSAGQRADSVGLGLWLVRSLAQAQGGTVEYVDAPDGGACFEVRLPSVRSPGAASGGPTSSGGEGGGVDAGG